MLGLVGCDHATKRIAETALRDHPRVLVPGAVELRYAENRDVAFSLLRDVPEGVRTPLIFIGGAAGLALLAGVLWKRRRAPWPELALYGVVLAGALGNLGDRLLRGYVVDFIYVHHWPIFNVADVLLVGGVGLLLLQSRRAAPA